MTSSALSHLDATALFGAWPIEEADLQFASIGDQLAEELNDASQAESLLSERHAGSLAWILSPDERRAWVLCGTPIPGNVHFTFEGPTDWAVGEPLYDYP